MMSSNYRSQVRRGVIVCCLCSLAARGGGGGGGGGGGYELKYVASVFMLCSYSVA